MDVTEIDLRDAARVNFYIDASNSWNTQLTLTNQADGTPIDISGAAATFKIKKTLSE